MYYVYILKSLKNSDIYIGSTADVENRISLHNRGAVKSTKGYRPWELLEFYQYNSRGEAVQMEKFYKTGQQKEKLKIKHGLVAKW
ncbi:MAG: GIY-YIG nuclease family protein [Parcubacteria group bacterium]|nr:GIY-YIG nuclease family protein [Parcubacteria group bacterium]